MLEEGLKKKKGILNNMQVTGRAAGIKVKFFNPLRNGKKQSNLLLLLQGHTVSEKKNYIFCYWWLPYSVDIFFHYWKVKVFVGLREMYFQGFEKKKSEHLGTEPNCAVQGGRALANSQNRDCYGKTGMNEKEFVKCRHTDLFKAE